MCQQNFTRCQITHQTLNLTLDTIQNPEKSPSLYLINHPASGRSNLNIHLDFSRSDRQPIYQSSQYLSPDPSTSR